MLYEIFGKAQVTATYCAVNWIEGSSIMWAVKYRAVPPHMHVLTTRANSRLAESEGVLGGTVL